MSRFAGAGRGSRLAGARREAGERRPVVRRAVGHESFRRRHRPSGGASGRTGGSRAAAAPRRGLPFAGHSRPSFRRASTSCSPRSRARRAERSLQSPDAGGRSRRSHPPRPDLPPLAPGRRRRRAGDDRQRHHQAGPVLIETGIWTRDDRRPQALRRPCCWSVPSPGRGRDHPRWQPRAQAKVTGRLAARVMHDYARPRPSPICSGSGRDTHGSSPG